MVVDYGRILWLAKWSRSPGPQRASIHAVWQLGEHSSNTGPVGRVLQTVRRLGWESVQGWWKWNLPGEAEALSLHVDAWPLVQHRVRECLRRHALAALEARRPNTFQGVRGGLDYYATRLRLSESRNALEKSLLRGALAGATWTACRAYKHGLRADSTCPFCHTGDEDEFHVYWQCPRWNSSRTPFLTDLLAAAVKVNASSNPVGWPPCVRNCGLIPVKWGCPHAAPQKLCHLHSSALQRFSLLLHSVMVATLSARMRADCLQPSVFPPRPFPNDHERRPTNYPFWELRAAVPSTAVQHIATMRPIPSAQWGWDQGFLQAIIHWLSSLRANLLPT